MLLKKLTEASGVSGNEHEVRKLLYNEIEPYVDDLYIDRLGNLIAYKNGKENFPHIMLAAHMDEVGLMVKSIDEKGFIKFMPVGGIDDRILVSKVVEIGKNKVKGVIGAKAIHLQENEERKKGLKYKQLYIDIGAKSKEEAEKLITPGDYISFVSDYIEFGNNLIKAKALDDRVGCAALVEILKNKYHPSISAVFTVQEEIGLRGAGPAAYRVNPDIAIILEGTTCYDVTNVETPHFITRLGEGPTLSILDMTSYFDKKLRNKFIKLAEKNAIKIQLRQGVKGGNDAGVIHLTREGIPSVALSVPCRYIHSPTSIIHKADFEHCIQLVTLFLKNVEKEEFMYE